MVSEQRKTEERRGTGFSVSAARKMVRDPSPLFYSPIFRADFDSRSSFFAQKPHGTLATQTNLQRRFLYRFTRQRPASGNEGNKCLKYFSTDSSVRAARIKGT